MFPHGELRGSIRLSPCGAREKIRKRVAEQDSASVSGSIPNAIQKWLENTAEYSARVNEALTGTGGPLKSRERSLARKAAVLPPVIQRNSEFTGGNTAGATRGSCESCLSTRAVR